MAGRFLPQRDVNLITRVTKELVGDKQNSKDGLINQEVVIYKPLLQESATNMYGESAGGKVYKPGVKLPCLVDAEDFDFNTDDFGPDQRQNVVFAFQRDYLVEVDFRPEIGDIVNWNLGYFEINAFNENQLVGGVVDNNHSIVATAHLTRLSTTNIEQHRGF